MKPDDLNVRLVLPGCKPLQIGEVLIHIRFYVGGRFRYQFILGRTDPDGVCRARFQNVERQLKENGRFFLMDYNTPLADCDSEVGIFALGGDKIAEMEAGRAEQWPDASSPYLGVSNHLVRCPEQKFDLKRRSSDTIDLVCERAGAE